MSDDLKELLEVASQVARGAGDVALRHFKTGLLAESKADGTPVTIADREAEARARALIEARYPEDGILGEELGEVRAGAPRRWVLDPIDGTKTFVRGVPLWGTLVAVARGPEVIVGAAYFPAVGELLVAARGEGCFWNGSRCRVSNVARLEESTVLVTDDRFHQFPKRGEGWRRVSSRAAIARTWGDCYGYLLVATGRAEVMADEVMAPWDSAALSPIIEEAGGVFTDFDGKRDPFAPSCIATNAALAKSVRALIGAAT